MIINRISEKIRSQDWMAISIEIVVVVFGILIAFQIDEWNVSRQERIEEREALINIRQELVTQQSRNVVILDFNQRRIDAAAEFAEFLVSDENPSADEYAWLWLRSTSGRSLLHSFPTYEGLRQNNRLSIVQNRELAALMHRYFEINSKNVEVSAERLLELRNELFSISSPDAFMTPFESLDNHEGIDVFRPELGPGGSPFALAVYSPVAEAPRNPEFLPALGRMATRLDNLNQGLIVSVELIEELIQLINQELGDEG